MTDFRWATLYSAEKYYLTNGKGGCFSVKITFTDEEDYDRQLEELKTSQKETNKAFKRRMRMAAIDPSRLRQMHEIEEISSSNNTMLTTGLKSSSVVDLQLDKGTGNTLLLLGASKQGKSTLMMHIYRKYYNTRRFISTLFSINSHIDVYSDCGGTDLLIKVPVFNQDSIEMIRKAKAINTRTHNKYSFLFMFDDIIDQKHSKIISELFLTYRNANISTIISLQYGFLLSKQSRSNVNNICLFRFLSDESIAVVVKTYLQGWFRKIGVTVLEDQINMYKDLTADHQFLYLNPRTDHVTLHKINI